MHASVGLHVSQNCGSRSPSARSFSNTIAPRRWPGSVLDRRRNIPSPIKAASGNGKDPDNNDILIKAKEFFDSTVEQQKKLLKEQADNEETILLQLEAMRAQGSPQFLIGIVEWFAGVSKNMREKEEARLKDFEKQEAEFMKSWKDWEQKTDNMEPLDVQDLQQYIATGEDSSERATGIIVSAFFSATLLSWVASWFGINVGTLLQEPAVPTVGDLTTFATWTVPYLGATAAAAAISTPWIGNRGTFRYPAEDSFFGKLHPTAIFSLATSLGYSQAVVYQGVVLLTFLRMFAGNGGGDYVYDPLVSDEVAVQQAMGSLVSSRGLGALLAVPAAVLSTATLEAGYFLIKENIDNTVKEILSDGKTIVLDPDSGIQVLDISTISIDAVVEGNLAQEKAAKPAESSKEASSSKTSVELARPELPSLGEIKMSDEEVWLTVGRVFLASAWLGTETMVTGNLWMAVGTGAAGMGLGMAARRSKARAAARTDS